MTPEQLQLGIGGVLTIVLLKIILSFVTGVLGKKESERGVLAKSLFGVQNDISGLTLQIKLQEDRQERFLNGEWPRMARTLENFDRRISHLEKDVSAIKGAVRGMSSHGHLTPPMGIPAGVPVAMVPGISQPVALIPVDDDEDDS